MTNFRVFVLAFLAVAVFLIGNVGQHVAAKDGNGSSVYSHKSQAVRRLDGTIIDHIMVDPRHPNEVRVISSQRTIAILPNDIVQMYLYVNVYQGREQWLLRLFDSDGLMYDIRLRIRWLGPDENVYGGMAPDTVN